MPFETEKTSKIIHIDMDCFYAAIEIRDNPSLADKPVAVGGPAYQRGVICTCNYQARQYGVRSAMATAAAFKRCKELVLLPVNMQKYKEVAARIHKLFYEFTDLVEPLSLDEAYLDVTNSAHYQGSATWIAEALRARIWETEKLTASAGVAPNKLLAKIASGWRKPNGLFVILPKEIPDFIKALPIKELYGVGKVTAEKLHAKGLKTCEDLQKISLADLSAQFGKFGEQLYTQCRGIDRRNVLPNRERKSISVEHTFPEDIHHRDLCLAALKLLYEKLQKRIQEAGLNHTIKNQFIKIKFSNFRLISAEITSTELHFDKFINLFLQSYSKDRHPIRLLGIGVHFKDKFDPSINQYSLF